MRILFCCTAAEGHFAPLVPLASAAREAGHDVAFATGPRFCERVRDAGFDAHPVGIDIDELERRFDPVRAELATLPPPARRARAYTGRFAEIEAPARLRELRALVARLAPDVLVHESAELAAPIVAAEAGIASVTHSFGLAIPTAALESAGAAIAPLWESAGLEPDRWAGAYRGPYVDVCPPSLQIADLPAAQPQPLRLVEARPPDRGDRPLVYVTLGTLFGRAALFRLLLDAFAEVDCEVLLTVGHRVEPAELGQLPANSTVERFVPQADVLPRASAVVAHGGSGSTLGALAHGTPLLLVPQGADQFENAAACAAAGAAITLPPPEQTDANLRSALEHVLADRSYAAAAERVAAEIAAMPAAAEVAELLFP